MATNDRDIKLRVSAQASNLSELQKAVESLERLEKSQEEFAKSATVAGASVKKLEQDLKELQQVGKSLNTIADLNNQLVAQRRAFREARAETRKARDAYNDYEKSLAGVSKRNKEQNAQSKALKATLDRQVKAQDSASRKSSDLARKLADVGVNSRAAQRGLEGYIKTTQKQIDLARNDVASFDGRRLAEEKKITEEKNRQLAIVRKRIAEERAVVSGFRGFSQNASQVSSAATRSAQVGPSQARERDVALDRLATESRLQAVLARNPQLQRAAAGASTQAASANSRAAASTKQLTDRQSNLEKALRRVAGQGRTTLSFFQRLRGEVLSLAATYGGLIATVGLAQQAIRADLNRSVAENQLGFVNNADFQKTAEDLAFVRQEADRLGQSFTGLVGTYARLRVAGDAANLSVDTQRKLFSDAAEAFTVLGLSQENVEGNFKAFEQSLSKGTIQAEELRGQLGDRLPGAFTKFAQAIGVSTAELNKLLEAGAVSSRVLPLFTELLADEARRQLPAAVNNLRASLARLQTSFEDFLVTISRSGFGAEVARLSNQLSDFFKSDDGKRFAISLSQGFSFIATAAQALVKNIEAVVDGLKLLAAFLIGRSFAAFGAVIVSWTTALAAYRSGAVAATVATAGLTAGTRALTLALGPIGVVLGLVTVALGEWYFRALDAERQAEALEDEIRALEKAHGDELVSLNLLNEASIKALDTSIDLTRKKLEEAKARQENAKRISEESDDLNALTTIINAFNEARAGREVDSLQSDIDSKVSERNTRAAQRIQDEIRITEEGGAALAKAIEESGKLQADFQDEQFLEKFQKDDERYNATVARARQFSKDLTTAINAGVLEDNPALQEQLEAFDRQLRTARANRLNGSPLQAGGGADASAANKAAERAAKEREDAIKRVREAAAQEQERAFEDNLARLAQAEETAVAARIAQVEYEYGQKIIAQREYLAQAIELGDGQAIAQITQNLQALESERQQVRALEERKIGVENLEKQYETLNSTIERLTGERDAKIRAINEREQAGLLGEAQARQQAYEVAVEYAGKLRPELEKMLDFLEANRENADLKKLLNIDAAIAGLKGTKDALVALSPAQQEGVRLANDFTSGLAQSFTAFGAGIADAIKGVSSFGDAFKAAADSFREFLADFLIGIGQAILQAALFNSLFGKDGTGGLLGGMFGDIGGLIMGASGFHTGGIVGKSAPTFTRRVPAGIFANAPRYHSGGVVGLKPDEVPAILQTGEEVLARNNPRNAMNGGASGGSNVQIINAIDSESVVAAGLSGNAGRQIIMNVVQANKAAFRQVLAS